LTLFESDLAAKISAWQLDISGTFYLARQLVFAPVINLYLQNNKRSSVRCWCC